MMISVLQKHSAAAPLPVGYSPNTFTHTGWPHPTSQAAASYPLPQLQAEQQSPVSRRANQAGLCVLNSADPLPLWKVCSLPHWIICLVICYLLLSLLPATKAFSSGCTDFFFFLIQRELQRPLDSFSHLKLKSGSHFYPESRQGLSAHLPLEVVHSSPAEPWPFFPLSWNQPPGDSLPSVVIVPSGAIPTNLGCTGFRKVKSQKKELCSPLNTITFESMSPCSLWAEVTQITKVLSTTLPEQINYLKIMPLTWLRYLYIRNIYGNVPECHSNPQDKYYSSSWNFNFKDAFEMREINIFKCIFALKCKITMFYKKKNKFCFFYGTLQIIVSRSPRQIPFSPAPIWGKHFKDCANISPPPCGGRCQKLEVLHRLDSLLQFLMYPNSNPKFMT